MHDICVKCQSGFFKIIRQKRLAAPSGFAGDIEGIIKNILGIFI